jgi:hypothetical protein
MVLALEDNPFDGLDEHDEKPKPILEDVRPTLTGDDLPSHMLSSLLIKVLSELAKDVQVELGEFHAKLSGLKSHGLFFDTHLELIPSQWHESEGMIKWVKYPGDSNQIEDELMLVVSAIYTCAIRGLVKQRAASGSDSGNSCIGQIRDIRKSVPNKGQLKSTRGSRGVVHIGSLCSAPSGFAPP